MRDRHRVVLLRSLRLEIILILRCLLAYLFAMLYSAAFCDLVELSNGLARQFVQNLTCESVCGALNNTSNVFLIVHDWRTSLYEGVNELSLYQLLLALL